MKLVKFEQQDGAPVFVNPERVALLIQPNFRGGAIAVGMTGIVLDAPVPPLSVRGTMPEVVAKLSGIVE